MTEAAAVTDVERPPGPWPAAFLFLAVAVVLFAVAGLSVVHLPWSKNPKVLEFPGRPWLSGWVSWDASWFNAVATDGYSYDPSRQSSIAFFPGYPLAMRAVGVVTGNALLAGILVSLAGGVATAALFASWLRERVSAAAAWTALALLAVYPFTFFLAGAVYAEGLFVASILAAFVLLERGHPVLAGLAGAVTTATRHVGLAVVAGLALRALERRGGFERGWWRPDLRRLRPADFGVLLSLGGIAAFAVYCWLTYDDPLAFAHAQQAWGLDEGARTFLKLDVIDEIRDFRSPFAWLIYVSHPILTVVALAFVPRVFRRFGTAYGAFSLLALVLPVLALSNFFGMGRYVIPAFPCFAAAGEWLAERPRLRTLTLAASALALLATTSFFARGVYLS